MVRIAALFAVLAAAVLGCGDNLANRPAPHTVGSGAINANYVETLSLATGTIDSAARYAGSIDLTGWQFRIASGTAVCAIPVLQYSNDYNPAVDLPTDETKWDAVTLDTNPPAIAGGAQKFGVQYSGFAWGYFRWELTCTSGSSTLTLTTQIKGG